MAGAAFANEPKFLDLLFSRRSVAVALSMVLA